MRNRSHQPCRGVACAVIVVVFLLLAVPPGAVSGETNPGIAPIQSHPHGHTYGEWAARWWQWALGLPVTGHPVLDLTGEHCAQGQTGRVWFLAGTFGGQLFPEPVPVERQCTVPNGTALFFPLISSFVGAFLNDPPEARTEAFLRAQIACVNAELSAEIDGVPVQNPLQYFEKSPLFDVHLPPDNIFGLGEDVIPELRLSPSVDQGFYLFVRPQPPGEHTLRWRAFWVCPFPPFDFEENVTYHLTVSAGAAP